uniref:POLAc domain-containing protein n=1 Tax=Caenorhabditis tropicalis TaxID=1561998 RepID=A0A1I7UGQ5_9PELO
MSGHEFVDELNKIRAKFARKFEIANMNELVWDQQLAIEIAGSGEELKLDRKLESYYSYEGILNLANRSLGIEKKDLKDYKDDYKLQFLAPLHNRIGCTTVPDENKAECYCYLAPDSPIDKILDTYGYAGSRCSEGFEAIIEGLEGTKGLCRQVIVAAPMSDGDFLIELNKKRAKFAKKFEIANMNKLVSGSSGRLIPISHDQETKFQSHKETLKSLDQILEVEKQQLKIDPALYELKFMAPLHERIDCSLRTSDEEFKNWCHLTPASPLTEMFDVRGIPGSNCSKGLESNTEGLCVAIPITSPSTALETTTTPTTTTSLPTTTTTTPTTTTTETTTTPLPTTTTPEP